MKKISQTPFEVGWIEENLFYRGYSPPKSKLWSDQEWVYLPHENYIPIHSTQYFQQLLLAFTEEKQQSDWTLLIEIMRSIYHYHHKKIINDIEKKFLVVNNIEPSKEEDLTQIRINLILQLIFVLKRANYNPFTDAEQRFASSHMFLTDFHLNFDLSALDKTLLSDVFKFEETLLGQSTICSLVGIPRIRNYLSLPKIYDDRVLIFHRGIGRTKIEGIFFMFRLRTLVSKLFLFIQYPLQLFYEYFFHEDIKNNLLNPFKPRTNDYLEEKELEEHDSVIFLPRWLRRTGPKQVLLKDLFSPKKITLQETTIHELVVVYSLNSRKEGNFLSKIPLVKKFFPTSENSQSKMEVKLFRDIPLADTEMVLPNINLNIRDLDRFILIVLVIIAFAGIVIELNTGLHLSWVIGLVLIKAIGSFVRFQNVKKKDYLNILEKLYSKNEYCNDGVFYHILNSIEEQEIKEAMTAYVIVHSQEELINESQIDEIAERFIAEKFTGLEVDFEVHDALSKITSYFDEDGTPLENQNSRNNILLPLIKAKKYDDEFLYEAIPLHEGLEALKNKWKSIY